MKDLIAELIADWSHAPALMIVPGALVAALLKRSTVACHRLGYLHRGRGVDTDPFRARFGERWLGADLGYGPAPLAVGSWLPFIHILLLLPILPAISIGYCGWGYIQTRRARRTN